MEKRDYYNVLGVSKGASDTDIKKAFRRKAKELHPDSNADKPNAESQFKELNEAYDVLKNPQKKAAYDRYGHAAFEGGMGGAGAGGGGGGFQGDPNFSSFSDMFEDLFNNFAGTGGGRRPRTRRDVGQHGADLRYNMQISLTDAYKGIRKRISIPSAVTCNACNGAGTNEGKAPKSCPACHGRGQLRSQQGFFTIEQTCPQCSGHGHVIDDPCRVCSGAGRVQQMRTLDVNIPKGVDTDTRLRMAGEGERGLRGGAPGDLYIFISVDKHPIFERRGADLFCQVPINMTTATLGGDITVPTIDEGKSRVKVPAGSQSGRQMRLRGKGMPLLQRGRRSDSKHCGDMFIELNVETPVNLTARQHELLQEFQQISTVQNNSPQSSGFIDKVKQFLGSHF